MQAESHEGAVGGQLLGAVGSALGMSAALNAALTGVLGFLIPGVGSFFGTIIGTMLGDAIAGDPAAIRSARPGADSLGYTLHQPAGRRRLRQCPDHEAMGDQVVTSPTAISMPSMARRSTTAAGDDRLQRRSRAVSLYHRLVSERHRPTAAFTNANDAIQQGVRDLLQNTEVIGGDLLLKRAHQAFDHPGRTRERRHPEIVADLERDIWST